jgi:hypothetical protein
MAKTGNERALSTRFINASQRMEASNAAPEWLKAFVREAIDLDILQREAEDRKEGPPDCSYPH